ncbi:Ig-like domain-containing protein [Methanobrevibacter sp.]|uniref:Ig-like domain-containing protein n=1 Tax=Methanobrevibacter sp. TaxID=66852 RepID=UPI003865C56F
MNKNILIIAVIVILLAIVGAFFLMQPQVHEGKINTAIDFLSEDTLKNGESVQFVLKDEEDRPLSNQTVVITFNENGENQTYSIITDSEGKGALVLNNEAPGSYDVYVSYNGTAKYNACTGKITITIEEGYVEASVDETSNVTTPTNSSAGTSLYNGNSSSGSQLHYDSQYNFYYDDNGIIRGGQNDGYSAEYIRNIYESGNMTDEDGNLQ